MNAKNTNVSDIFIPNKAIYRHSEIMYVNFLMRVNLAVSITIEFRSFICDYIRLLYTYNYIEMAPRSIVEKNTLESSYVTVGFIAQVITES